MAKPFVIKLKRPLFWVRFHKFYSLLLFLALFVAGIFIYEKVALEFNRMAFKSARQTIDVVYGDIVKQVGAPDNSLNINECSRSHLELSEGPLSCSVNTDFIYGVKDKSEADGLMTKIKSAVAGNEKIFKAVAPPKSEIPITPSVHDVSDSEVNYYSAAGLFCGIKYVYDVPREMSLSLRASSQLKGFFISVGCSDWARAQYYSWHIAK